MLVGGRRGRRRQRDHRVANALQPVRPSLHRAAVPPGAGRRAHCDRRARLPRLRLGAAPDRAERSVRAAPPDLDLSRPDARAAGGGGSPPGLLLTGTLATMSRTSVIMLLVVGVDVRLAAAPGDEAALARAHPGPRRHPLRACPEHSARSSSRSSPPADSLHNRRQTPATAVRVGSLMSAQRWRSGRRTRSSVAVTGLA